MALFVCFVPCFYKQGPVHHTCSPSHFLSHLRVQAVTGDMQGIDRVMMRVKAMYEPIEAISFNVFDYGNNTEWKAVKATFYSDNEDIKVRFWCGLTIDCRRGAGSSLGGGRAQCRTHTTIKLPCQPDAGRHA